MEKTCPVCHFLTGYHDHIMLLRQISKKPHRPEVGECIRIVHQLHAEFFSLGFLDRLHSGFGMGIIYI